MTDPMILLGDWLRYRRDLGEVDLLLADAGREAVLRRVARLVEDATTAATEPGRVREAAGPPSGGSRQPETERDETRWRGIPDPATLDEELSRLACEADAGEVLALPDLPRLRAVADACTRCPLHESRTKPVFADGSPDARVLCVGEAPGQKEDETGLPFVGRAGQLLDRLLLAVGMQRREVFICNVLKCRPPGNRNPQPEEIERCSPFLLRQIELVDPEVIVAFGTFAARTLLEATDSLGRMRKRVHRFHGRPLVVTYHPAALLRNPAWSRPTWEDLQRVRGILDDGPTFVQEEGPGASAGGSTGRGPKRGRPAPTLDLGLGDGDA